MTPMQNYRYQRVLLIDDSYIDNLINRKIIESSNFAEQIKVMESPVEAMEYLKDLAATNSPLPEVVFLDLRMPGMSGFDFLTELQEVNGLNNNVFKIFVLSSSLDPSDHKRIEENHLVSKFIGKPLTRFVLETL